MNHEQIIEQKQKVKELQLERAKLKHKGVEFYSKTFKKDLEYNLKVLFDLKKSRRALSLIKRK